MAHLSSPAYLPTYPPIYLPAHAPTLPAYLPTNLPSMPTLPAYPPIYPPCPPTHLPTYLLTYSPYLPTLPTHLPSLPPYPSTYPRPSLPSSGSSSSGSSSSSSVDSTTFTRIILGSSDLCVICNAPVDCFSSTLVAQLCTSLRSSKPAIRFMDASQGLPSASDRPVPASPRQPVDTASVAAAVVHNLIAASGRTAVSGNVGWPPQARDFTGK